MTLPDGYLVRTPQGQYRDDNHGEDATHFNNMVHGCKHARNNSSLGSRWTQTATQMNGYLGSVQILPDQIQLLNSLMILLFLPIFQKLIYPAFEWCGVTVSPLRKMSLGQVHHLFDLMFG